MSATRLFRIINILLDKPLVSAPYLAEELEVSIRTIYRDIDKLTLAGIPVYTTQGKGGGISLLSHYVLNKTLLSNEEQELVITALNNMPVNMKQEDLLLKLKALFQKQSQEWLSVDLSSWGDNEVEIKLFDSLKSAILSRHIISFEYINIQGLSTRCVKPVKLIFKSRNWYLQAFCMLRNDFRVFKLSRIKHVTLTDKIYEDEFHPPAIELGAPCDFPECRIRLNKKIKFRVYEEFTEEMIEEQENGYIVCLKMPIDQWLVGYLLSFGGDCEILSPDYLKEFLKEEIKKLNKIYKT